jgi:DNA-binding winged helix-turn-helix (wHTH) protein/Tol biopolymer transport system component
LTEKAPYIYEFESFRLDPRRKSLWHRGELVPLTPKAFETLHVLVRNSGEVVEKSELLDEVWADTFVEESTLSQNILTLRKTLGSFGEGTQFIATVPRRGYRFVPPVQKLNGAVSLTNGNGRTVPATVLDIAAVKNQDKKKRFPVLSIAAVVILLAVASVAWFLGRPSHFVDTKFGAASVSDLLSDGNIRAAGISPDGKLLSLIETRDDKDRILVRHVNDANLIEVVPQMEGKIAGMSFSPDSQSVFYNVYRNEPSGERIGELYRASTLGGPAELVLRDIDSPVSLSKSGKICFVRRRQEEAVTEVVVADREGKNEKAIATRKADEGFSSASMSPDGHWIVATTRAKTNPDRPMELMLIDAENGDQKLLTTHSWLWLGQTAWLGDGSGVAVVGYGAMSPDLTDEVWFVSVPDGKVRLIQTGVNGVFGVSITDDSNSIVAVKSDKITSFVVAQTDDISKEQVIVTKAGDRSLLQLGADWSGDRIFYSTTDNGNADVWSVGTDGSNRKRLTADKFADLQPRISPDGQYLYFLSNRSGKMSIWRSKPDGTGAEKITDGSDVFWFDLSPDGRSIFYTARADSVFVQYLYRSAADGKDPVRLTQKITLQPRVSPDGKTIACFYPPQDGGQPVLTILNANGEVIRQFPQRKNDFLHEWADDGRELFVVSRNGGGASLWKLSTEMGDAKLIGEFPDENIFRMTVSPKRDRLFYEKGVSVNNVVLISSIG